MLMLTIEDAVKVAMDYIHNHCDDYGIDHEDEELMYQDMEQKCWINNNQDFSMQKMFNLIMEITPSEICLNIEQDNLKDWCVAIQGQMQMELIKMKGSYNE